MTTTLSRAVAREQVAQADMALAAGVCQVAGTLPTCVNLVLYAGDDFYLDLEVVDTDGDPVDLSNAVASAQIKARASDPTALASFIGTVSGNLVMLHLPHNESRDLPPMAVWDCQIATPDITTLCAGTVATTAEVTQP